MADNRSTIPYTNEHMVEFLKALQAKGSPYWYGTCVFKCTEAQLTSKAKQYPGHYTSGRMSRYRADVAAKRISSDCIGAIKGYMWTNGGEGVLEAYGTSKTFTVRYGSNGCPDKSANDMFSWAKSKGMEWGSIGTIPEIPGVAVRYDGHVGVYIGGGKVVEWRGFAYGSQITNLASRKWLHWYKLPFINYGAVQSTSPDTGVTLGSRLLKKGMTGADVKALQELLMQLGYELPEYGADSDFGDETERAVIAFQKAKSLDADGEYGPLTHAALMDAVADNDADLSADDAQPEETPSEVPEAPAAKMVQIVSKGGSVNIRSGNGAEYGKVTTVAPGCRFEYIATAVNGWHAVKAGDRVGWVHGDYGKLV